MALVNSTRIVQRSDRMWEVQMRSRFRHADGDGYECVFDHVTWDACVCYLWLLMHES